MIAAYILIQVQAGKAATVGCRAPGPAGRLGDGEPWPGPYVVIARAQARDSSELAKLVTARAPALDGVTRTICCPVVHR